MPTIIELHLISHFSVLLFAMLAIKMFYKTKANVFCIALDGIMFAIIKWIVDFYCLSVWLQFIIIFAYLLPTTVIVHKLDHVKKMISAVFLFTIYIFCLSGLALFISQLAKQDLYFSSNMHLFCILGINFIIFGDFCIACEYLKTQNPLKLTCKCFLTIGSKEISLVGYLDSGNVLKVDGKSVVVVSIFALEKHITDKMYCDLIFATNNSGQFEGIKKINYSTISGKNCMTAFNPVQFKIETKKVDCLVAITTNRLDFDAILCANI